MPKDEQKETSKAAEVPQEGVNKASDPVATKPQLTKVPTKGKTFDEYKKEKKGES